MHAQCLSSPTLFRFLLSQNGKNEDLLELAHRLGILDAAPVHVQYEFLELFLHCELPQHGAVEFSGRGQYLGGHNPDCPR